MMLGTVYLVGSVVGAYNLHKSDSNWVKLDHLP